MRSHNIHEDRIITAGRIVTKEEAKWYTPQSSPMTIKLSRLIKEHLCEGKNSRCVKTGKCECLDVCNFGKAYMKRMGEADAGK